MDLVSVIAASAAPLTIIGTAVVTIVNRHYDIKQKQTELYEARRLDAVNNFADTFAKMHETTVNTGAALRNALAAVYMVIPYFEPSVRENLSALARLLRTGAAREDIYTSFDECLNLISLSTTQSSRSLQRVRSGKSMRQPR